MSSIGKAAYRCIHCGNPARKLYQDFSKGIIKVEHCTRCGDIVDKYIEYDPVIICLDALLLKMQAFRHVLYNSQIQSHVKLTVILLLCDAFLKLMYERQNSELPYIMPEYVIYSAMEWRLYWNYLLAGIELLVYLLFLLLTNNLSFLRFNQKTRQQPPSVDTVIRGLLLANFGKVLVIPVMIWSATQSILVIWISKAFVCISNIQVIRAMDMQKSLFPIFLMVVTGQFIAMATVNKIDSIVLAANGT